MRRLEVSVDVVMGGTEFGAVDWGYGLPRFLAPGSVRVAAEELGRLSYRDLINGVDVAELTAAQIYPQPWDSPESLEWGRDYFEGLALFLRAAARRPGVAGMRHVRSRDAGLADRSGGNGLRGAC